MIEPIVTSSLSIVSSSPAVIDTVTALLILSGCSEKIDALKMYTHLYNMDNIIVLVTMPAFNTWAQTQVQCSIFDCYYISGDYHELLHGSRMLSFSFAFDFHSPSNGRVIPTMIFPNHL